MQAMNIQPGDGGRTENGGWMQVVKMGGMDYVEHTICECRESVTRGGG